MDEVIEEYGDIIIGIFGAGIVILFFWWFFGFPSGGYNVGSVPSELGDGMFAKWIGATLLRVYS